MHLYVMCCYFKSAKINLMTIITKKDFNQNFPPYYGLKSVRHRHLMLCRGPYASLAFCSLIAYSWLALAACDTQRPVVSKEHDESTRSKSQISPEWAERHKFSPTDCCLRHVLPIEHMNNEHSHGRLLCQGQGLVQWNAVGNKDITVCEDANF